MNLILRKVSDSAYHLSESSKPSSMLTRYGILTALGEVIEEDENLKANEGNISFEAKRTVSITVEKFKKDLILHIPLSEKERIFGGGDSNRERVMVRGSRLIMHIANVRSYGPMPVLLSDNGWAIVLNTTYSSVLDIGQTDKDELTIRILGGELDFYLFKAETLKGLINAVTSVTGRPMILPKFAYGYQFILNQNADQHQLLETSRLFREKNIPCDSLGLEPDWMAKHYDYSTEKCWNRQKFPLISWQAENQSGVGTMFYPLRRMGMALSLWLCEDYDLIYHEENLNPIIEGDGEFPEDAEILDPHLIASVWQDQITKRGERWFDHLKKFVDNGAQGFKLDGSNQVLAHPDRLWGSKYLDEEVHNIYPVLLVKDMKNGYQEYTDRRVLLNSAGAYIGTQKYAATWAGDTGGGPRTLVSVMNYSMCGHANTSCDIDIHHPESTHYGFLMPWTQQNTWDYHYYPWYMGDEILERVKFYATLRSTLFPHIYSAAHTAHETGMPILRPLPLVYEGEDRFDDAKNVYMLGDSLLVGAFDMHIPLPDGEWIDYFTGETYEGGGYIDYNVPECKGGALLVKKGAVVVTMKPQKYILEKEHDYVINLYPGDSGSSASIYEDDGYTYDYENGGYALTRIISSGIKDGSLILSVKMREGGFAGRPDNGHSITNNSIPKISPTPTIKDMTVFIHGEAPKAVMLDGKEISLNKEVDGVSFILPAELHEKSDISYEIKF